MIVATANSRTLPMALVLLATLNANPASPRLFALPAPADFSFRRHPALKIALTINMLLQEFACTVLLAALPA